MNVSGQGQEELGRTGKAASVRTNETRHNHHSTFEHTAHHAQPRVGNDTTLARTARTHAQRYQHAATHVATHLAKWRCFSTFAAAHSSTNETAHKPPSGSGYAIASDSCAPHAATACTMTTTNVSNRLSAAHRRQRKRGEGGTLHCTAALYYMATIHTHITRVPHANIPWPTARCAAVPSTAPHHL